MVFMYFMEQLHRVGGVEKNNWEPFKIPKKKGYS